MSSEVYSDSLVYEVIQAFCVGFEAEDVCSLFDVTLEKINQIKNTLLYKQTIELWFGNMETKKSLSFEDLKADSIKVLKDIITDPEASNNARLAAAKTVFDSLGLGKKPPKMKPDTGKFSLADIKKFTELAEQQREVIEFNGTSDR